MPAPTGSVEVSKDIFFFLTIKAMNWLIISVPDPYHLAGSVPDDTDPGIAPKTNQNHVIKKSNLSKYMMKKNFLSIFYFFLLKAVLRIRIRNRIRIRSDPYHLAGSGSGSGSVLNDTDPDPGRAKN